VLAALVPLGKHETTRQRLRDLFRSGGEKRVLCRCDWEITLCFAPLLRWLHSWWHGADLAFALDAATHGDRVVLAISVLYRDTALPVVWHALPANRQGEWTSHCSTCSTCSTCSPPPSPPTGAVADRRVGTGVAFKPAKRQAGTLVVVWETGQAAPWMLLTDLAPDHVGVVWYGLRVWVEPGFRTLKSIGWQWQRTRRSDPERMARHWLVLAIATLWTVAVGTRVEEATARAICPTRLWRVPRQACDGPARSASSRRGGAGWCAKWCAGDYGTGSGCCPNRGRRRPRLCAHCPPPEPLSGGGQGWGWGGLTERRRLGSSRRRAISAIRSS
jgi:hypothetical protein